MKEIRLTVRCLKTPDHTKLLKFNAETEGFAIFWEGFAELAGKMLSANSDFFVHPPGDNSPIGVCCRCQGELSYDVETREGITYSTGKNHFEAATNAALAIMRMNYAEPKRQRRNPGPGAMEAGRKTVASGHSASSRATDSLTAKHGHD